jgi:hypothetical protein
MVQPATPFKRCHASSTNEETAKWYSSNPGPRRPGGTQDPELSCDSQQRDRRDETEYAALVLPGLSTSGRLMPCRRCRILPAPTGKPIPTAGRAAAAQLSTAALTVMPAAIDARIDLMKKHQ